MARSAFLLVRDQIAWLDDLERAGEGLKARDVLGLISYLKEERNCSVAVLLNDEAMIVKDRDDFQRLVEKVNDVSVTFSPTPARAALLALGDSDPISRQIGSLVETLAFTNIHVIRKIATLAGRLSIVLQGAFPEIIERAVRSVTLAGWGVLEPGRLPTISDLLLHNRIGVDRHEKGNEIPVAKGSNEHVWAERISRLGFDYADDFDGMIFDGASLGYFGEEEMLRRVEALEAEIPDLKRSQGYALAWDSYRGSLRGDEEKVV